MSSDPKARVTATYDAAADHFDHPALSFRPHYGEQTAARAHLRPGEIVLDICSGTGASALPAARAVAPTGRVIGLDLSPALISLARQKAAAGSVGNVEFRHADFDQAYFRNASFDAILCGFGIAHLPDARTSLQKMWRLLRHGGRLTLTTWGPRAFEPGHSLFWETIGRIRPDLYKGTHSRDAFATPDLIRGLFDSAGLPAPEIEAENRDELLRLPDDWWTIVLGSGYRGTVDQLTEAEREQVRTACLSLDAAALPTPALHTTLERQTAKTDRPSYQ